MQSLANQLSLLVCLAGTAVLLLVIGLMFLLIYLAVRLALIHDRRDHEADERSSEAAAEEP